MTLRFSKMHGLGNDFVVIDAINQHVELDAARVRALADRHYGIGCDQLLVIEPARNAGSDFFYRIYNADGSEVAQCGNGARCFARYVRDHGLINRDEIRVDTAAGAMTLYIEADGQVRVNMGLPHFEPAAIPFLAATRQPLYTLEVDGDSVQLGVVSLGNPHAVLRVDDIESAPVESLGPRLESHPAFPERANIGFMQILERNRMRLRVFERGAGETRACGSGACAAMVIARQQDLVDDMVTVELRGGNLQIYWKGEGEPVWMTGPAAHVFEGRIEI
ncbi:MAG: diaminopimelate epimerase [Granulosicoccaceae bacterium]|jgi:diaminopimelate epimerase